MNATQTCSIDGCERKRKYAKTGWCQTHYHRWRRNGDTSTVRTTAFGDPYKLVYRSVHLRIHRLWGHANQFPCVTCGQAAKEWAYDGTDPTAKDELIAGQWPVKFSVHPEFYFPACYPCHRALDAGARAARRERCGNGHELTPDNTYVNPSKPGSRECRACRKSRSAERYLQRKAARDRPAQAVLNALDHQETE
ncbi:hypothetical protein ACFWQG_13135 [Rhodococcus sp. NPDC058532]|uniref:hypothetical protein n=1 Tax=Rhodococcus sp. NPDC058532 TaxID=3346540 RepID=UPI003649A97E